jgi:hypothetical protein
MLAFLCVAMSATMTGTARAAAPDLQGWWTAGVPIADSPVPAPPDVPADGLLVQGSADAASPTAYAALVFQLGTSTVVRGQLTLAVAAGSTSVPGSQLQLCPLTTTLFSPEQGGAAADAPPYSCATHMTGTASPDGHSYAFAAAGLVVDGVLAVAVVPTAPTDRVVFAHPGADALPAVVAAPTGSPGATEPSSPVSTPSTDAAPGAGGIALPPDGGSVTATPGPAPRVAPQPSAGAAPATLAPASGQAFSATDGSGAGTGPRPLAVAALAAGLLLAAAAWGLGQRSGIAVADAAGSDETPFATATALPSPSSIQPPHQRSQPWT